MKRQNDYCSIFTQLSSFSANHCFVSDHVHFMSDRFPWQFSQFCVYYWFTDDSNAMGGAAACRMTVNMVDDTMNVAEEIKPDFADDIFPRMWSEGEESPCPRLLPAHSGISTMSPGTPLSMESAEPLHITRIILWFQYALQIENTPTYICQTVQSIYSMSAMTLCDHSHQTAMFSGC